MDCHQPPAEKPKLADVCPAESPQTLNSLDIFLAQVQSGANSSKDLQKKAPSCYDELTPQGKKAVADAYSKAHKEEPIGDACMDKDGTIQMRLRRAGPMHVDAHMTYKKGSEFYNDVLKHLGGLKQGEIKLVAPWPDDFGNKKEAAPKTPPKSTPGDAPDKRRGG